MDDQVQRKFIDFFAAYPAREHKAGQILLYAGDEPDSIMQLVSGRVKMYDLTQRGDEVVLNVYHEPTFFPMGFAINRTPNIYYFEAQTDVTLRRAPINVVLTFVKENSDVMYDLLSRLFRGTDGLLERMAHLMTSSAKSRVIFEILIECRRFGAQTPHGCKIGINETDIGARAGLSRETVNREISKLKSEGLIAVIQKCLYVTDQRNLELALGREI